MLLQEGQLPFYFTPCVPAQWEAPVSHELLWLALAK